MLLAMLHVIYFLILPQSDMKPFKCMKLFFFFFLYECSFHYKSYLSLWLSICSIYIKQKNFFFILMEHGKSSLKASLILLKNIMCRTKPVSSHRFQMRLIHFQLLKAHYLTLARRKSFSVIQGTSHSFSCHCIRIPILWVKIMGRCSS